VHRNTISVSLPLFGSHLSYFNPIVVKLFFDSFIDLFGYLA